MRAKATLVILVGGLLATGTAISYGWQIVLGAGAVVWLLVLVALVVRALRRANRLHHRINREELDDDPDPFRKHRPVLRDHDDTEEQP